MHTALKNTGIAGIAMALWVNGDAAFAQGDEPTTPDAIPEASTQVDLDALSRGVTIMGEIAGSLEAAMPAQVLGGLGTSVSAFSAGVDIGHGRIADGMQKIVSTTASVVLVPPAAAIGTGVGLLCGPGAIACSPVAASLTTYRALEVSDDFGRSIVEPFRDNRTPFERQLDQLGIDPVAMAHDYDLSAPGMSSRFQADLRREVLNQEAKKAIREGRFDRYSPDDQTLMDIMRYDQDADDEQAAAEAAIAAVTRNDADIINTREECEEFNPDWAAFGEAIVEEACKRWLLQVERCVEGPGGSVPIPWNIVEEFSGQNRQDATDTNNRFLALYDLEPRACAKALVEEQWDEGGRYHIPWHEGIAMSLRYQNEQSSSPQ